MADLAAYIPQKATPNMGVDAFGNNPNLRRTMAGVLAHLPKTINGDVLDIGPGCGWEIPQLEERYPGKRVEVVTVFEEEAVVLRTIARDAVHVCDMHDLPDDWAGRFGLVFASLVLDHSPAPYIALCEWARVLKPDGLLFLSTPNPGGYTGLGSKWPARLGDFVEHVFSASFETTMQMIRHVPPDPPSNCNGIQAFRLEAYHEVPHISGQRVHYWRRIWKVRKR